MFIPELFLVPPPAASITKIGMTHSVELVLIVIMEAIAAAILVPLFWLAVWKRKNWARWTLFLLLVIPAPAVFLAPRAFRPDHLPMTITACASLLVESVA